MGVPPDVDDSLRVVLWVGKWPQEVPTVDELEAAMFEYSSLPEGVREQLEQDRVEYLLESMT